MPSTLLFDRYALKHGQPTKETVEYRLGGKWAPHAATTLPASTLRYALATDDEGKTTTVLGLVERMWLAAKRLEQMVDDYRNGRISGHMLVANEHPIAQWSADWDKPHHRMRRLSQCANPDQAFDMLMSSGGLPETAFVGASNSLADLARSDAMTPIPGTDQKRLADPDYLANQVSADVVILGDDGTGMDQAASDEFIALDAYDPQDPARRDLIDYITDRHHQRIPT